MGKPSKGGKPQNTGKGTLFAACIATALTATVPQALLAGDFDQENSLATAVQIALPLIAGFCAMRQDKAADFLAGVAVESAVVHGLKLGAGDASFNRRPSGGSQGFPSGHSALAMFGATSIARKCVPDRPVLGALAYGAAFAVAASRVRTGKHTGGQALAGLTIGYFANGMQLDLTEDGLALGFSLSF